MAFSAGWTALFSFDGTDLSAFTKSAKITRTRKEFKLPRLGGNTVAKLVGPTDDVLHLTGWIDEAVTGAFNAAEDETAPTLHAYTYTTTPGGQSHSGQGYVVSYDESSDADQANMWTAVFTVDSAVGA